MCVSCKLRATLFNITCNTFTKVCLHCSSLREFSRSLVLEVRVTELMRPSTWRHTTSIKGSNRSCKIPCDKRSFDQSLPIFGPNSNKISVTNVPVVRSSSIFMQGCAKKLQLLDRLACENTSVFRLILARNKHVDSFQQVVG
jgi:hypothetical protein